MKTQQERVMDWLENHEYINRVNAINDIKPPIWNLTAVIADMRQRGINIESVPMKEGKRYVHYKLGEGYGNQKDANQVCNR